MRGASAVGLSVVLLTVPGVASAEGPVATRAAGWRGVGVVMNGVPTTFMSDASTSGVFVAVGSSGAATTMARRSGGRWVRARLHIGSPVGVDVNDSGDAMTLSVRGDGAVLATAWRHGAARPRTSVLVSSALSPSPTDAELVADGRGDLAAVVKSKTGRGPVILVRKLLRKPWGRPMSVGPHRYHGVLDSIDVGNGGEVVGAFRRGATLSIRLLKAGAASFGAARQVTQWAEPGRHPTATDVHADVRIGRGGDVATLWSYRSTAEAVARFDVLPVGARRFQQRIAASHDDLVAVGDDGSVLLAGGLRWSPHSRRLLNGSSLSVIDANSRGDALLGPASRRGRLAVWPLGQRVRSSVAAPSGRQVGGVLTTDLVAYLVVVDAGRLRLSVRGF